MSGLTNKAHYTITGIVLAPTGLRRSLGLRTGTQWGPCIRLLSAYLPAEQELFDQLGGVLKPMRVTGRAVCSLHSFPKTNHSCSVFIFCTSEMTGILYCGLENVIF
jgi:hypothetical protein